MVRQWLLATSSFLDASNEFYGNKCVCCVSDFYCGTERVSMIKRQAIIFDAVTDAPWLNGPYPVILGQTITFCYITEMHSTIIRLSGTKSILQSKLRFLPAG